MYLKKFRGATVRDALRAARETLGPEALVLSTALVPSRGWRGWIGAREVELTAAAERDLSADRRPASDRRPSKTDPASAEATARLSAAGLDETTAAEVVAMLPKASRRGASLLSLRGALAQRLSALASDDESYARVEVFVGPPGAGKTTTIAKIASQEYARGGRRLGLLAADGLRVGAVEQLGTYAEILGAPFRAARTLEELDAALDQRHRYPILIDTAGRSASDPAARDLFRVVGARRDIRTHLVIPASTSVGAVRRLFDSYAEARPSRLILTKVDEAESLSPLVELLRERQMSISYLGTGQRIPEDLRRASADLLAASVLGEPPATAAARR